MTVDEYLDGLPPERRAVVDAVRAVVLRNLPEGYEERVEFGMLAYVVPLSRYPDTYNGRPLQYAALAAQKRYYSLYLMCVYGEGDDAERFKAAWRATGKRLDMGKSCVRFRSVDDLPLDLVAAEIGRVGVGEYIARYEAMRSGR